MLAGLRGAGFSRWAADLPVASELFDFQLRTRGEREHRRVELVHEEWAAWRIDHPRDDPEQFVGWALQLPNARRRRVIWYVARRLSDPFLCSMLGGSATFQIDDKRVRELASVQRAQRFLQRFLGADTSGLVTCNYDLLVEYALTTRYFNYGTRGERLHGRGPNPVFPSRGGYPALQGTLPLAKLHGSVSWDTRRRYTDGRRGLIGEALIVPPRPEKEPPAELAEAWTLARNVLSRADRLVVFGFGFNPYDHAVRELLTSTGTRVRQVLLIDVAPQPIVAQTIWPRASVVFCGPPDRQGLQLERWFD